MRILTNTTSPYARIARIALAEKGFDLSGTQIVNPWSDDAGLLKLNPASRVPTLELDSGVPLTESLLIVAWLERKIPKPSLLDGDADYIISRAGVAMGVIDAMANIVTGVMQMEPELGRDPRWPQAPTHDRHGLQQARVRSAALWRRDARPRGDHGGCRRRLCAAALQGCALDRADSQTRRVARRNGRAACIRFDTATYLSVRNHSWRT